MKSRKIKIALAASALSVTSLLGVASATTAFAQDGPTNKNTIPTAEQIVKHQAEKQAQLQIKLDAGVEAGSITQNQADAISAFFEANKTTSQPNKNMTKEERKAAKDERKAKIEAFASENDISLDFLKTLKPLKGGPGHGR